MRVKHKRGKYRSLDGKAMLMYKVAHRCSNTEIAKAFGCALNTVGKKLKALREKSADEGLSPESELDIITFYRSEQLKLMGERDKLEAKSASYCRLSSLIIQLETLISELCHIKESSMGTAVAIPNKIQVVINDVVSQPKVSIRQSARAPLGESECE